MNSDAKAAAPAFSNETTGAPSISPPLARREPVETVLHGDRRVDHYAWLRQKDNPEVIAYLEAENTYTDAILRPTEAFQESLYQEMVGRILQTDLSVPYRLRGFLYFTCTEQGKQYPIHCRRVDRSGSLDEMLLTRTAWRRGTPFWGPALWTGNDNQLLAYALDTSGFRQYTLHIKNLWNGAIFPEAIERVTSAAWAADNRALFYTVEDPTTKRSHRLFRHSAGSGEADALIYEETDERFRLEIERTRSGAFLLLVIASHTTSEVAAFKRVARPNGEFRNIAAREVDHEYYVDHHPNPLTRENRGANPNDAGGYFFIRTNSGGRTFRLVCAPVAEPERAKWREIVPNRRDVMISGADVFRSHMVLSEREGGLPYLRIVDLRH